MRRYDIDNLIDLETYKSKRRIGDEDAVEIECFICGGNSFYWDHLFSHGFSRGESIFSNMVIQKQRLIR